MTGFQTFGRFGLPAFDNRRTSKPELATRTTGLLQQIRPEGVLEMKVAILPPSWIQATTTDAEPIFGCINHKADQSRTVAILRGTLLPKVLRGGMQKQKHHEAHRNCPSP